MNAVKQCKSDVWLEGLMYSGDYIGVPLKVDGKMPFGIEAIRDRLADCNTDYYLYCADHSEEVYFKELAKNNLL